MELRALGSLRVSVVGLGCNNFGMRIDAAATERVVDAALDAGINFFDTADIYGGTKSEEFLGRALARTTRSGDRRDEVRHGGGRAAARRAAGVRQPRRRGQPANGSEPTTSTSTSCISPIRTFRLPTRSARWTSW